MEGSSVSSVFLMPGCSGNGIYVVLIIEVSYVVMVGYPHWGVIIVVLVGRNNTLSTTVRQWPILVNQPAHHDTSMHQFD